MPISPFIILAEICQSPRLFSPPLLLETREYGGLYKVPPNPGFHLWNVHCKNISIFMKHCNPVNNKIKKRFSS